MKVLDQASPRNQSGPSLTQSHGPKLINNNTSSLRQSYGAAGTVQSKVATYGVSGSKKKIAPGIGNQSSSNQKNSRGGYHQGKAVVQRDKRPQSKRGTTVDQSQSH